MRRTALLLAVAIALASLLPGTRVLAGTAELVQRLDQLTASFPGGAGIWIADPATAKPLYAHNSDEAVITASLYKLAILAEAERRVDAGQLRYADMITIEDDDITDDGSFEPAGTQFSVDQALEAMITISDNGAALALWHVLGPENVNAMLRTQGITSFHVALALEEDNVATPKAVGTLLTLLAKRQLISPAASDRMVSRLSRQQINNRLPAALPDGVVVAHKTGNLPGITHDAGIIYTKFGPRVVVVMTWDAFEPDADAFIADVGSLVYSAVLEPPANAKFDVPRTALLVDIGSSARITVPVSNVGSNAWTGSGPSSVRMIWEMRDSKEALVAASQAPLALPGLDPGRSANVGVVLAIPKAPGEYKVTLGLVDADGRALAALGAATATFALRAHQPYLVTAETSMPGVLHQGEASLLVTRYTALPNVDQPRVLALTWRLIDPRNGRVVKQGSVPVGTLDPGAAGTFFYPFVAPNVLGRYRLSYELRDRTIAVSETFTSTVLISDARTYPDDEGGRTPGPIPQRAAPSPTPRFKFPLPSGSLVPQIQLPSLPTPRGRATPSPAR